MDNFEITLSELQQLIVDAKSIKKKLDKVKQFFNAKINEVINRHYVFDIIKGKSNIEEIEKVFSLGFNSRVTKISFKDDTIILYLEKQNFTWKDEPYTEYATYEIPFDVLMDDAKADSWFLKKLSEAKDREAKKKYEKEKKLYEKLKSKFEKEKEK